MTRKKKEFKRKKKQLQCPRRAQDQTVANCCNSDHYTWLPARMSHTVALLVLASNVAIAASFVLCEVPNNLLVSRVATEERLFAAYAPYAGATRKVQTARQAALTKDIDLMLEGIAEQVVCLEEIPQIQFELIFHVVSSDDNGDVAALTAAMVMSLAKASIPMTDVVAASTTALMPSGVVTCDPTAQELRDSTASCTVVAATSSGEVCFAKHHGNVDVSAALQLLEFAVSGAMLRRDEMRSALSSLQ
ncbi:Hypothetical protein, putative [Bodo saltans]|uniref:Uncharacterized protein n=1 Tax=Bodo saltans TaxID=75058 RepID=A0A0S4JH49_BODSA|nr:Hypothetical protein, putative [Bodo saltans]|eukprot:CUG89408.1 Hypothetical protein, putative [Bodo saltans]